MLKKLTMILAPLLLSGTIQANMYNNMPTDSEAQAFKDGFQLAVTSLIDGREFRLQGRDEESVNFHNYMVMVDATDLDDADKFAIQKIGFIYADSVRLTDERIVIASFERKGNAVTLSKKLNREYFNENAPDRRAYTYEKQKGETFYREKSFTYNIAEQIEKELKSEIQVIYIEDKKKVAPKKKQKVYKKKYKKKVVQKKKPEKKPSNPIRYQAKKPEPKNVSKLSDKPFFVQILPKGRYITKFKLTKAKVLKDTDINSTDLIKQNQIENNGNLVNADNYLVTNDGVKFYVGQDGYLYKASATEIVTDFIE